MGLAVTKSKRAVPAHTSGHVVEEPIPGSASGPADKVVVLQIVRKLVDLDIGEARSLHVFERLLAAPHRAKALAALGERHGHAVHHGESIKKTTQRMVDVLVMVTVRADILSEINAVFRQRAPYAPEQTPGTRLIMDGVEGGDELECGGRRSLLEVAQITDFETDVGQAALAGPAARPVNGFRRQVDAGEIAARIVVGQLQQGLAAAAPQVEHADAGLQPAGQLRCQRQDVIEEGGEHRLAAVLGHHCVEATEAFIGDAATVAKAFNDVVLDVPQHGDELGIHAEVGFAAVCEQRGMFPGQVISAHVGIEHDDAAGGHGSEPFAYVTLVEAGASSQLLARHRRCRGERGEQAEAVAERGHQQHAGLIEGADKPLLEAFHGRRIRFLNGSSTTVHGIPRGALQECALTLRGHEDFCYSRFSRFLSISAMAHESEKYRVAFLTLPESTGSTLYGMYDLFAAVDRDWGVITHGNPGDTPFEPFTVAADAQGFRMANGVYVLPDCSFEDLSTPDVICVPELLVTPDTDISGWYPREIAWLRSCYEQGSCIGSACSGALLIAEAGLLDGQDATTHWGYCQSLAQRYPTVRVHPNRALVTAGETQRLVMVGGGSSWQDLALYLIARMVGLERALQVSKLYLIDWHSSGQQPYAALMCRTQHDDAVVARCQQWLAEHYDQPHPVRALVELSGLSERSFKRRFHQATGMPPLEYVHTLRLEEAKQWLESSNASVEAIVEAIGYEDASFFSRLFRRKVGLTPTQYRRRFGALRRVLAQQDGERRSH